MPLNTDTIRAGASAAGVGAFYTTTIDQSLRFEDGSSAYLTDNFSASNYKTATFSCWVKRSNLTSYINLFSGGQGSSNNDFWMRFSNDDTLNFANLYGGSYTSQLSTVGKFRDTTNWYHVVFRIDTTQATDTDRVRIYVNGTQQTLTGSFMGQDTLTSIGFGGNYYVGRLSYATLYYFDGYLAEVNFIDGTSLPPETFGETKNGVWIPKAISGLTYGQNGFRLTFGNSSNIGEDSAGSNDFTANNLGASDIVADTPSNNFAVMSKLNSNGSANIFEGGLRATMGGSGNYDQVRSDFGLESGKWYWEVYLEDRGYIPSIGVMAGYTGPSDDPTHWVTFGFGAWHSNYNSNIPKYNVNQNSGGGTNWTVTNPATNDIIMVAIDVDNNKIWWGRNGTWYNSSGTANPATGTDARVTLTANQTWHPMLTLDTGASSIGAGNAKMRMNFGQDSTFAGYVSNANDYSNYANASDQNGVGSFFYAPPSGYLACCTSSITSPVISPDQETQATDNFTSVIYNANNQTAQNIDTVGFKPDFLWFKQRTRSDAHSLFDSSRGIGPVLRLTNLTEYSNNTLVTSFRPLGFALGTDTNAWVNYQTDGMVAWCWKGNGGTPVSNTQGNLTCNVQANADAGFSIVTWTGNGNAAVTLGHGLNAKPDLIIYKGRENSFSWPVWFKTFGTTTGSFLDTNTQPGTFARVTSEPTTTVIPNAELNYTNTGSQGSIAYVFTSVVGYSKIDQYTGNNSTNGTYVHTGFRPAWIIFKRINGADNWAIYDVVRDTFNPLDSYLYADLQQQESTFGTAIFDVLSNGFKWRGGVNFGNADNGTYLYMAFADQPFKFSNAR